MLTDLLARVVIPARCAICRGPAGWECPLCPDCDGRLRASPRGFGPKLPGLLWTVSAFDHDGIARDAMNALKFSARLELAGELAGAMVDRLGNRELPPLVVAVPPSPLRSRLRGFDAPALLAASIAAATGRTVAPPGLVVRVRERSQRGRGRAERIGRAPRFEVRERLEGPVLLVDDVLTTGATLDSASRAVRGAGAGPVCAVTATRRS